MACSRISSLCVVVGLASAAATAPCQGDSETCAAAEPEDQVSALQVVQKGQHSFPFHHGKCPHRLGKCKTVQSVVDAVDSTTGTIIHAFANSDSVITSILDKKKVEDWNAQYVMNDCVPDDCWPGAGGPCTPGTYINHCSAWSLIKTGWVPLAYNYPNELYAMHPVSFLAKLTPNIGGLVTRRHIVDGDTWQRTESGMHVGTVGGTTGPVVDEWNKNCPTWVADTGKQIWETGIACVEQTQYPLGCNVKDKVFEVAVGKGGVDWPKNFMYDDQGKVDFTKANTMIRQCEFHDEALFESTLKVFYAELAKLSVADASFGYPYPAGPNSNEWGSLYMDSELNFELPGEELKSRLMPDMLAIVVSTTPCVEQLSVMKEAGYDPAAYCAQIEQQPAIPGSAIRSDKEVIERSVKAACYVQQQLLPQKVPVVDAKLPTNSMTQASWVKWATSKVCECSQFCEIDCKEWL